MKNIFSFLLGFILAIASADLHKPCLACAADLANVDEALYRFPEFDSQSDHKWTALQAQFENLLAERGKERFQSPLGPALWSGANPIDRQDFHIGFLESLGIANHSTRDPYVIGLAKNTSIRQIFFSIYNRMKELSAQKKINLGQEVFPSIELSLKNLVHGVPNLPQRIRFRPGINAWPDLEKYEIFSGGLIEHFEWIRLRAAGHFPFDFLQWDHDLAHLSTYIEFPKYFSLLQTWYALQASYLNSSISTSVSQSRYLSKAAKIIDESAVWINSNEQVDNFKAMMPPEISWENSTRPDIEKLDSHTKKLWMKNLLVNRDRILTRHGAIDRQLHSEPTQPEVRNWDIHFKEELKIALNNLDPQEDENFKFASSLSLVLDQMKSLLNLNATDMANIVVFEGQASAGHRYQAVLELLPKVYAQISALREKLLNELIVRFFLGYRIYVQLKLSPIQMIEDFEMTGLKPDSKTAQYLRVFRPEFYSEMDSFRTDMTSKPD